MLAHQHTLARPVRCSGVGVHSGRQVTLLILPAPVNHGIKFVRTDLPDRPTISAHFNNVVDTSLATVIGSEGAIVSTIEHLMASLFGLGIDNALIEIDNYEVPIMDGSAQPFTAMLKQAGFQQQGGPRHYFIINRPIILKEDGKRVELHPADSFKISCTIEYQHPLIKRQSLSIDLWRESFEHEICNARTFGFLYEIEHLKTYGFAKGGSLDNVVAIGQDGVLNQEGLRFEDEFVRHKILDCIGDVALLGLPIQGHLITYKSGHAFNHAFLKQFFNLKDHWQTQPLISRLSPARRSKIA